MENVYSALSSFIHEESISYMRENYQNIRQVFYATEEELQKIPKIGPKKAKQIRSIMQLSMELMIPEDNNESVLNSPDVVFKQCRDMTLFEEEHFVILLLDTKNKIKKRMTISKGILNAAIVHPREVFAPAIRHKANSIIAVHNHPSGNTNPSNEDIELTGRLKDAGHMLGIPLIDHIIIANNSYISLKEKGLM